MTRNSCRIDVAYLARISHMFESRSKTQNYLREEKLDTRLSPNKLTNRIAHEKGPGNGKIITFKKAIRQNYTQQEISHSITYDPKCTCTANALGLRRTSWFQAFPNSLGKFVTNPVAQGKRADFCENRGNVLSSGHERY